MRAVELFLISGVILFLELACIRWFPAHVLFLTFFTNIVLLASFLGMSVGCLAAGHKRTYIGLTPILLALTLLGASLVERVRDRVFVDVGHQVSPQMIFFGTEYNAGDVARFVIPVELLGAFFFVAIALVFVGPGQVLGRALQTLPNRIRAYSLNIAGSLAGISIFAACSFLELSPIWWFGVSMLGLSYWVFPPPRLQTIGRAAAVVVIVTVALATVGPYVPRGRFVAQHLWSPYYRIDYTHDGPLPNEITVNLIGHQRMTAKKEPALSYPLPHLLNRDAGGKPFENVLIIGAGSGNDVSRALQWGAKHVDAVEIDPTIYRLGRLYHPDQPYSDPRVTVHLDDGRNYLRATNRRYDLVIYALVDSLVLHSSYSNIRLESYLFTRQAFADVHRVLQPDGVFAMYNYFRQGWLVTRLELSLKEAFGANPLVMTMPFSRRVESEAFMPGAFTLFLAGGTEPIQRGFETHSEYWVANDRGPSPESPNGFSTPALTQRKEIASQGDDIALAGWVRFAPATVVPPAARLLPATDDWPFPYLRERMIPLLSIRSMLIMGALGLVLIAAFVKPRPRAMNAGSNDPRWLDHRMFFLGAGFMLIETKAVVHMALLFGSTWVVNSVVFFALLLMILAANVFVLFRKPEKLWPYYVGVLASLAANAAIPLEFFLGLGRATQVVAASSLVFVPILFAAVIFAVSFSRSTAADQAFGSNIAGAILGGLSENLSMLLGFRYLMFVAMLFYAISAVPRRFKASVLQEEVVQRRII